MRRRRENMNAIITEIRDNCRKVRFGRNAATVLADVRHRTFERGIVDKQVLQLTEKLRNKGNWKYTESAAKAKIRRIF